MLCIVYADSALLVLEKPADLLAVPGRGDAGRDNLAAHVQAVYADARVAHRLDMATSGLMLFARGAEVHRALSQAFAERQVHKRYQALVEGKVQSNSGEINAALRVDWPNRPRQVVDALQGKPSLTRWVVLGREGSHTRLALEPVTGRSHQLRVHLQSIGHPIVGDKLYGSEPPRGPRLMLHACSLALAHPSTREAVSFESPVPF